MEDARSCSSSESRKRKRKRTRKAEERGDRTESLKRIRAETGKVVTCDSEEKFDELLGENEFSGELRFTNVLVLKVDIDNLKVAARNFGVDVLPAFMFVKEGKFRDWFSGVDEDVLKQMVTSMSATQ